MKKILGIEVTDEEFDKFFCEQANGKELKVVNGKIVAEKHTATDEELKQLQIAELKQKLLSTDYLAIKYAEGELTADEYAETKAQRQEWRNQLNELGV